ALRLTFLGAGVMITLMPLVVMALPPVEQLILLEEGPVSWRQRLIIWKTVWAATLDHPFSFLFGHGVEAAKVLRDQLGMVQLPGAAADLHIIPNHPHNIYLQIWYEMGVIGVLIFLLALWQGGKALEDLVQDRAMIMAIVALASGTVVLASIDASLWTWWRVMGPTMGGFGLYYISKTSLLTPIRSH
ncbi:MAG: O-antigen ligase family protein, partial [Pseudomonadota bacterium]